MYSIKSIFHFIAGDRQTPVNDNSAFGPISCGAECAYDDPYLTQSCEARQLVSSARLIGAADGNPAMLLNVLATRRRPAA